MPRRWTLRYKKGRHGYSEERPENIPPPNKEHQEILGLAHQGTRWTVSKSPSCPDFRQIQLIYKSLTDVLFCKDREKVWQPDFSDAIIASKYDLVTFAYCVTRNLNLFSKLHSQYQLNWPVTLLITLFWFFFFFSAQPCFSSKNLFLQIPVSILCSFILHWNFFSTYSFIFILLSTEALILCLMLLPLNPYL